MCFEWERTISTSDKSLKLVDKFIYFGSNISSTESDVNIYLAKVWTAINRLSTIWKSDLSVNIKQDFFQAMVVWMHHMDINKTYGEKDKWEHQLCAETSVVWKTCREQLMIGTDRESERKSGKSVLPVQLDKDDFFQLLSLVFYSNLLYNCQANRKEVKNMSSVKIDKSSLKACVMITMPSWLGNKCFTNTYWLKIYQVIPVK